MWLDLRARRSGMPNRHLGRGAYRAGLVIVSVPATHFFVKSGTSIGDLSCNYKNTRNKTVALAVSWAIEASLNQTGSHVFGLTSVEL
jgi:hypothetical protein